MEGLSATSETARSRFALASWLFPSMKWAKSARATSARAACSLFACLQECVCRFSQGVLPAALRLEEGPSVGEKHAWPVGVRLRRQRESLLVEAGGGRKGVQGRTSGRPPRRARSRARAASSGSCAAGRAIEVERAQVVVRDHLREVLGAGRRQRLDPVGRQPVHLRPPCARDLAVGDVADEDVAEDELGLARDRRCGARAARTPCARARARPPRPSARGSPSSSRGRPARRPSRRSPHPGRAPSRREGAVEAGRDDALDATPGAAARSSRLEGEHAHVLLGVERVSARPREQLAAGVRPMAAVRRARRASAACRPARAGRARSWSRCACRRPSPACGRGARDAPCRG